MSSPVSSRLLILVEQGLEGAVPDGVVGGAVLPAVPDDEQPGAGEDADGVGVVVAPGAGSLGRGGRGGGEGGGGGGGRGGGRRVAGGGGGAGGGGRGGGSEVKMCASACR